MWGLKSCRALSMSPPKVGVQLRQRELLCTGTAKLQILEFGVNGMSGDLVRRREAHGFHASSSNEMLSA